MTYYVANKRETTLFDFAVELLTLTNQGNDFKLKLLNHQKMFNIKRLDLSDVGTLLEKKAFQVNASASEFDSWLQHFWKFWHEKEIHDKEAIAFKSTGVLDYPILQAACDSVKSSLKPSELKILPL